MITMIAETSNLTPFFIGLAIGGAVALAGGLIEYGLHLRRKREPRFGVPGCFVYVIGGLVLAGIVAIGGSLIFTGSIDPALTLGAGVLIGFYGGFLVLLGAWLFFESRRLDDDPGAPSDSSMS